MDFSGAAGLIQEIPREKNIEEPQMMEFSSSIADILPSQGIGADSGAGVYMSSNDKVAGISLGDVSAPPAPRTQAKKSNPFNLTDEQTSALLAGIVAVIVFSSTVQTKLAGTVPNFSGINGSIASLLVAAFLFFMAHRFIKNR
jgi:hypothetical protein